MDAAVERERGRAGLEATDGILTLVTVHARQSASGGTLSAMDYIQCGAPHLFASAL